MRVLVIGATGYIGSRLIAALLAAGDDVVAGARDPLALDAFWWSDRVERRELDVLDADSVGRSITSDLDAVVYLVHGMARGDFAETDATAARLTRDAVDRARVARVVYLSGIIPDVADEKLSEHLRSRLEVERELSRSSAATLTVRAAMILGAGSTSFELMRQLSARLPITVIPDWMHSEVEPIAVVDVIAALAAATRHPDVTGHLDVGGGTRIAYPDLIDLVAEQEGAARPQVSVPLLPEPLVAKVASWLADVPDATVSALMESLQEDMCAADDRWRVDLFPDGARTPLDLMTAMQRSLAAPDALARPSRRDPQGPLPGDPAWAGSPR